MSEESVLFKYCFVEGAAAEQPPCLGCAIGISYQQH